LFYFSVISRQFEGVLPYRKWVPKERVTGRKNKEKWCSRYCCFTWSEDQMVYIRLSTSRAVDQQCQTKKEEQAKHHNCELSPSSRNYSFLLRKQWDKFTPVGEKKETTGTTDLLGHGRELLLYRMSQQDSIHEKSQDFNCLHTVS